MKLQNSEGGFSLVAVMIAIGIASVALLAYNAAFKHNLNVRKSLSSKRQANDALTSIQFEVTKKFSDNLGNLLFVNQYPTVFNSRMKIGNEDAGLEYRAPEEYSRLLAEIKSKKAVVSGDVEQTLIRCQNLVVKDTASQPFYHFCLLLVKGSKAPAGSFESAEYGFVEFAIKVKDLKSFSGLSVQNYVNNTAPGGLEVYYNLIWSYRDTSFLRFHNKRGSFIASKPQ